MKSKILLSVLVIMIAVSMAVGGTMAYFTDPETAAAATFTTGKLDVSLNGGSNSINLGEVSHLAPGEVTTTPATILIENTGNINLAWFGKLAFSGDPALLDFIYIDSMKMEFLYPDGVSTWETADPFIIAGGHSIYPTPAMDEGSGVVTLRKLMGNPGMNSLGYENMGALKPGYQYRLSFTLGLLYNAGNNFMNLPVNLSYEVIATQINVAALTNQFGANAGIPGYWTWFNTQINKQH